MQTKLKLGSQHDPSLGPDRSNRNAHCRLWNCAAALSPRLFWPPPVCRSQERPRSAGGADPPSARPAQWRRAARASPPPRRVTAGGSRNLATPPPRLRRRRRAAAEQSQNGGLGAGGGDSRPCQTPCPLPPPRPHRSGSLYPPWDSPDHTPSKGLGPLLSGFGE